MVIRSDEIAHELSGYGIECNSAVLDDLAALANSLVLSLDTISEEYLAHSMSQGGQENFSVFSSQLIKTYSQRKSGLDSKSESVMKADPSQNTGLALPTPSFSFFDGTKLNESLMSNNNIDSVNRLNTPAEYMRNDHLMGHTDSSIHDELAAIYGYTPARVKQSPMNIFSPASIYPDVNARKTKLETESDFLMKSSVQAEFQAELDTATQAVSVLESHWNGSFVESNDRIDHISFDRASVIDKINPIDCDISAQAAGISPMYISERIENIAELIKQHHGLQFDQFHPIFLPKSSDDESNSQKQILYIRGRICKNIADTHETQLNFDNLMLEGCLSISNGKRVFLRIPTSLNFSLFPGQVVVAKGHFDDQEPDVFYVRNFYSSTKLPRNIGQSQQEGNGTATNLSNINVVKSENELITGTSITQPYKEKRLNLVVAAGPFLQIEDVNTEFDQDHLLKLFQFVRNHNIKLIIMIGPFFKFIRPQIHSQFELMRQFTKFVENSCKAMNVTALMVPSLSDISVTPYYPIRTLNGRSLSTQSLRAADIESGNCGVHWTCSPCRVQIDQIEFVVGSQDILIHLGANELNNNQSSGGKDRISRLLGHLINQQSMYPLYPAYKTVNINLADNAIHLTSKPDIIILPSDLRYFIKNIEDIAIVNPGRCLKGKAFGFLSRFSLVLGPDNKIDPEKSTIQILSI